MRRLEIREPHTNISVRYRTIKFLKFIIALHLACTVCCSTCVSLQLREVNNPCAYRRQSSNRRYRHEMGNPFFCRCPLRLRSDDVHQQPLISNGRRGVDGFPRISLRISPVQVAVSPEAICRGLNHIGSALPVINKSFHRL